VTAPSETSKSAVRDDERHARVRAPGPGPAGGGSAVPVAGLLQATADPPSVPATAGSRARPGLLQRLLSSHSSPPSAVGPVAAAGSAAGVIRRAPKRKAEGSDSEEESSSDESEVEEDARPVRASTRKQTVDGAKKPPRKNHRPGRGARAAAAEDQEEEEEEDAEPDFRVSNPALYEGSRGALWFYQSVLDAMELVPRACVRCGTAVDLAIDHKKPISAEMSTVDTDTYCYGGRHYEAATFEDALSLYNARLSASGTITAPDVSKHFQWMCGPHNSSKGGKKGIDTSAPALKGRCPDPDDCEENQVDASGSRMKKRSDYE